MAKKPSSTSPGRISLRITTLLLFVLIFGGAVSAYSVLTHEQIVDLVWADDIRPLLLSRFPALTEALGLKDKPVRTAPPTE